MSGEFRGVHGASFMWEALQKASLDPGVHEVSTQLAVIYNWLRHLEEACAWAEACDSAPSTIALALMEHGHKLRTAVDGLMALEEKYRTALDGALRRVSRVDENIRS